MNNEPAGIWVYLSSSPLIWLTLTLLIYQLAYRLYSACGDQQLLNPVLVAVTVLVLILATTQTPYQLYFEGAQFIHFLLGPATVALAIPLYAQLPKLRRVWLPVTIAVFAGVIVAPLSAMLIGMLLGGSPDVILSLAPKSVTTPVAMGISEVIGGIPSLTAVIVVITGVVGAATGTGILKALKITDHSVCGLALGVSSHGVGTARAFQVSPEMGAFSGLAMALSAVMTSFILPWLIEIAAMAH